MTVQIPYIKKFKTRPEISYKQIIFCQSELNLKLELSKYASSIHWIESLADIYPSACLIEVYSWFNFFQIQNIEFDPNHFSSAFGFHWNDTALNLFESYKTWPDSFKTWAKLKKAHINDLRPLILTSKLDPAYQKLVIDLLITFNKINPSLNQGKQIIELFVDIAGTDKSLSELQKLMANLTDSDLKVDLALKKLLKLRYPLTTNLDQKNKNFAEKSNWPSPIKVCFKRQGDKAGFELSAFVSTKIQCESTLIRFDQTLKSLANHLELQNHDL